jgi:hypothetical protein
MNKSGQQLREVETSFGLMLKNHPWIPATVGRDSRLLCGKDLFVKTQDVLSLLANHVSYLFQHNVGGSTFGSYLGIRKSIDVDFVADLLKKWCQRSDDEKLPVKFSTSLAHIRAVYEYLHSNMIPKKFTELISTYPVIFYACPPIADWHAVTTGMFLMNTEAVWLDPSCLFEKYHDSLNEVSPLSNNSLCRYILQPVYPDKQEFVCRVLQVQRTPDEGQFIQLLIHIATTCTIQKALRDVLTVFSVVGKNITKDRDGAVSASVKKQVELLKTEKVFPTKKGVWVELESCPMIADDRKMEKLFSTDPTVFFVDCGEKLAVDSSQQTAFNKGKYMTV